MCPSSSLWTPPVGQVCCLLTRLARSTTRGKGKGKAAAAAAAAPRAAAAAGYSLPVDVFAYGATIYELLTFEGANWGWPYGWAIDLADDEQVERAVLAGKPPSALGGTAVPKDCPAALRAMYEDCVAFDAAKRPTFDELVPRLRELLRRLREGEA